MKLFWSPYLYTVNIIHWEVQVYLSSDRNQRFLYESHILFLIITFLTFSSDACIVQNPKRCVMTEPAGCNVVTSLNHIIWLQEGSYWPV